MSAPDDSAVQWARETITWAFRVKGPHLGRPVEGNPEAAAREAEATCQELLEEYGDDERAFVSSAFEWANKHLFADPRLPAADAPPLTSGTLAAWAAESISNAQNLRRWQRKATSLDSEGGPRGVMELLRRTHDRVWGAAVEELRKSEHGMDNVQEFSLRLSKQLFDWVAEYLAED